MFSFIMLPFTGKALSIISKQRFKPSHNCKSHPLLFSKINFHIFLGLLLNFIDHVETSVYLGLGPMLVFDKSPCVNLWILGLLSSAGGKLLFSFAWSLLFQRIGLRPILLYSWTALALSSLCFGLYGFYIENPYEVSLSFIMCFRFFQSLFSNAQTHASRAWIFSKLSTNSSKSTKVSALFGISTSLGIMGGLGVVLLAHLFLGSLSIWPWIYAFLFFIALSLGCTIKLCTKDLIKNLESPYKSWPKSQEIFMCFLISSFSYCTYYWACLFLPSILFSQEKNQLLSQIQTLALDSVLMLPLGIVATRIGPSKSLRFSTLGCLLSFFLFQIEILDTKDLRWLILILGVLCTCAHSAWIKERVRENSFFPSSLLGGAFGSLFGSLNFYFAKEQASQNLAQSALPFMALSFILLVCNEREKPFNLSISKDKHQQPL